MAVSSRWFSAAAFVVLCQVLLAVAQEESFASCPAFDDGNWAIGELRNQVNAFGQTSKMQYLYENRSPRACCDACMIIARCKYWTWLGETKRSTLGNCTLFESFACDTDPKGNLPLNTANRRARSGSNVCSRPETRDKSGQTTLQVRREAAIAEVKSHFNAEIAVRQAELAKLKAEEEAVLRAEAEAEAEAAEEEHLLALAKLAEAQAAAELAAANAKVKKAVAALKSAQEAEAASKAKLAEEEAIAAKIVAEEERVNSQLEAAKAAKASADEILATQIMLDDKDTQEEDRKMPFRSCPTKIEDGQWAVGTLRTLEGPSGSFSQLLQDASDVTPRGCCDFCSKTVGCTYWNWIGVSKGAIKGSCSLFQDFACNTDAQGNQPYDHRNKLGRVGKACSLTQLGSSQ